LHQGSYAAPQQTYDVSYAAGRGVFKGRIGVDPRFEYGTQTSCDGSGKCTDIPKLYVYFDESGAHRVTCTVLERQDPPTNSLEFVTWRQTIQPLPGYPSQMVSAVKAVFDTGTTTAEEISYRATLPLPSGATQLREVDVTLTWVDRPTTLVFRNFDFR
jgi:hypothetical protein